MLLPGRHQRLHTGRLTRRIQRLDRSAAGFFIRMIVTLGHYHRPVAGEVFDLPGGHWRVGAVLPFGIRFSLLSRFVYVFDLAPRFLMYDCIVFCSPLV